ncbi:sulfurtransferase TusA family protein [Desulfolutivibrio sulfoxidireducens]|uniref:sulfurtransferase TusA family protein n=1 Tax=Desulfolutivibrio sulfoxidireducens TaxID=2773299 RepID=UPI001FEB0AB9|nr:sulfurtransferase TusA family protein [Desulfolutivibrio sulfoxidireducens]
MMRIDLRNSITPLVILHIGSVLRNAAPGEGIEILCDEESIMEDFRRVHHDCSCTCIGCDTQAIGKGCLFVLRKTQTTPQRSHDMSELDLSSIQVSSTSDARGSACPGPLLEAKKGIGKVKVGEVLEIYSNDSGTRTDIPAWAKKVGHDYLGLVAADGYDKHFVRRKK